MNGRRWIAAFLVMLAYCGFAPAASAQNLVDKTVGVLLQSFETRAANLMNKASQTGNLLMARMGVEVRVATENLGILLDDQRGKVLKDLSPDIQNTFLLLNTITEQAENGVTQLQNTQEFLYLDVQELLNGIPGIHKRDFFVSSVSPISVAEQDAADYWITIRGVGFGLEASDRKYRTNVTVGSTLLPGTSIVHEKEHQIRVRIPNAQLAELFSDDALSSATLTLTAEVKKRGFLSWGRWRRYELAFDILLFPGIMGEASFFQSVSERYLGEKETRESPTTDRAEGCETKKPCRTGNQGSVAKDRVIQRLELQCVGDGCAYCYCNEWKRGNYSLAHTITNDGSGYTWTRYCDGYSRADISVYPITRKYETRSVEKPVGTYPLRPGRVLTIDLSNQNPTCNWRYTVRLRTGETGESNSGIVGDAPRFLRFVGSENVGDHCRVNFVFDLPAE